MADALLIKTLVVILASVCAISLVARIGLPAAAGYLLAGFVIGPHGLQLIATSDETRFLAELGIIFLMFMVGLEFAIPTTIAARRDVFGAGSLQVGFTVLIVAAVAMLWGVGLPTAMLLGGRNCNVIDRHHAQAIGRPGRRRQPARPSRAGNPALPGPVR